MNIFQPNPKQRTTSICFYPCSPHLQILSVVGFHKNYLIYGTTNKLVQNSMMYIQLLCFLSIFWNTYEELTSHKGLNGCWNTILATEIITFSPTELDTFYWRNITLILNLLYCAGRPKCNKNFFLQLSTQPYHCERVCRHNEMMAMSDTKITHSHLTHLYHYYSVMLKNGRISKQ